MEIRAATFEDVDSIRDLMVASMASIGPGFYTAEQTAAAARYLTVPDLELIKDRTLYVAVVSAEQLEGTPTLPSSKREAMPWDAVEVDKSSPSLVKPRAVFQPELEPPSSRASYQGEPSSEIIVGVGGWSSRRKLFTGSADQEGLVGRLDPLKDAARIRSFFVDARFARRGIARRLYERCAAEAWAAGFRRFSLMATLPGVPLYRVLAFGEERPTMVRLPDGSELPCVEMGRRI